jgi:phage shock protein E
MKTSMLIALVCTALVLIVLVQGAGATTPPAEAKALVDGGALLVDVRTPEEFASGHIEGAKNIPVSEVQVRLAEFGAKDGKVVVYCRSGNRSGKAKTMLEAAGYTAVFNAGAYSAWPKVD